MIKALCRRPERERDRRRSGLLLAQEKQAPRPAVGDEHGTGSAVLENRRPAPLTRRGPRPARPTTTRDPEDVPHVAHTTFRPRWHHRRGPRRGHGVLRRARPRGRGP